MYVFNFIVLFSPNAKVTMSEGVRKVEFADVDVMREYHVSPESIYELQYSHRATEDGGGEKFLGLAFVVLWPDTCNSRLICNSLRDYPQLHLSSPSHLLSLPH